jgi:hypothetical protein
MWACRVVLDWLTGRAGMLAYQAWRTVWVCRVAPLPWVRQCMMSLMQVVCPSLRGACWLLLPVFWPLCAALSRPVLSCHIVGVLSRSVLSARARQQSVAQVSKATQCHTLGEQCLRGLLAVQVVCFLCLTLVDGLQQAAVCTCCFLAAADC